MREVDVPQVGVDGVVVAVVLLDLLHHFEVVRLRDGFQILLLADVRKD